MDVSRDTTDEPEFVKMRAAATHLGIQQGSFTELFGTHPDLTTKISPDGQTLYLKCELKPWYARHLGVCPSDAPPHSSKKPPYLARKQWRKRHDRG